MEIVTEKKTVSKNVKDVYEFVIDLKNFEQLMPDSIDKFEVLDTDTFLFALKGMPQIVLKRKKQQPFNKLVLGAASEKLPFTLTVDIDSKNDNQTEVMLSFEGEFNSMMAMMIKTPITNFMNALSDNLSEI
ncbi:SRPBCC family protein [uncultured Eudoraea sp.]|uniref:SRPBCC family protein n=1 Tax=uncultured Eudoraea sp. TaxID=1035614 RepID=UPI002636E66F|nr:SRPBCC family protein [uncultured Eudoraea sp.]